VDCDLQHTTLKSSVSIQVSSNPASIKLTSSLCIQHQDYQQAIVYVAHSDKSNLFRVLLDHENRTCMALLICKHPSTTFCAAHYRLLSIGRFCLIFDAHATAFKALINPEPFMRLISIKPHKLAVG
jgi:hypothetical protein